jgi:hypothetical protein
VSWHSTRRSFVRAVYDNTGHDLVKTQRVVGHSSPVVTVLYLSWMHDELSAAVMAVERPGLLLAEPAGAEMTPAQAAPAASAVPR